MNLQARAKFTILNEYQDQWPAKDFATMYLKNKVGGDKAKMRARSDVGAAGHTIRGRV